MSHRRRVFVIVGVVCALALAAGNARAQILYGSITGIARDAQGAAIPGATVTIINKETNLTRDTITGADGSFTVNNVLPGPYDVKISLTGFREAVRTNVPVTIVHADGMTMVKVDQRKPPPLDKAFVSLGTFRFEKGKAGYVEIGNKDVDGHVIIDAVQWLPKKE